MNCPNCQTAMLPIKTVSKYGTFVFIDQCPQCGGIWFDKDEMYLESHQQTDNFVDFNKDLLIKNTIINKNLICPRDNKPLSVFNDPYFSKKIHITHCDSCGGSWFNYGEFAAFQDEREKVIDAHKTLNNEAIEKDDELQKSINKLLANDGDEGVLNAWGSLGKFLSQPIDNSGSFYSSRVSGIVGMLMGHFI